MTRSAVNTPPLSRLTAGPLMWLHSGYAHPIGSYLCSMKRNAIESISRVF